GQTDQGDNVRVEGVEAGHFRSPRRLLRLPPAALEGVELRGQLAHTAGADVLPHHAATTPGNAAVIASLPRHDLCCLSALAPLPGWPPAPCRSKKAWPQTTQRMTK